MVMADPLAQLIEPLLARRTCKVAARSRLGNSRFRKLQPRPISINVEQNLAVAVTAILFEICQAGIDVDAAHVAHHELRAAMHILAPITITAV
jgi:hypothetical protein